MGTHTNRVKFNVRGKIYETTATILTAACRNSMFGTITGTLHVPSNVPQKLLYNKAHYYGLLDHVRTAKWGNF
ncbi:hypothetical protein MKX01_013512 [Papaver californicum]|nr:hypothetical protein MKX01_013512 [Papaver californicum]